MNKWNRANYQPNLPLGQNGRRVTACKEHIELSKEAAREGMVLLKNEDDVLPLKKGARIALFGKGTFDYVKGGGGSGDVTVPYIRNLYEGFEMLGEQVQVFDKTADFYRRYVRDQYEKGVAPGMLREPELSQELIREAAAFTDTAVISISRFSGEGWDRKSDFDKIENHKLVNEEFIRQTNETFEHSDYYLSDAEKKMTEQVTAVFRKVIIVMNVGGMVDSSWFKNDDRISAVLMAWQGGMEGGTAEAELLCGLDNPSGKLCDTFADSFDAYPSSETFYESDDYVDYYEDIYVGYRYFETIPGMKEKVNYPFGFGLSYTRFELTDIHCEKNEEELTVSALVRNIGKTAGKEVVQLYGAAPQGKLGKENRRLIGFQKTLKLEPGCSQEIRISCRLEDMASYDDLGKIQKSAWILEKGRYDFYLGTDVRSAGRLDLSVCLTEDRVVQQLSQKMAPTALSCRLLADGSTEGLPMGPANDPNEDILERMPFEKVEFPMPQIRACRSLQRRIPAADILLKDVAEGKADLKAFMAQLSDEDLCWLVGGQPNVGAANTFGYGNNPVYGIPNIMTADGPAGLRIQPQVGVKTTAFPCSTLLACTWNPEIAEKVGEAGGREVKENNISVWLTPAINIHRTPLCGRNFEYYSEDPFLTARMAGAMVRGIQSNHIGATVKHMALNNKETNRKESDSRCSERAIREIYLKAFERIVKEENPWSIMTSYNMINGHRASENKELLTDILREEWHYEGMVTTDWWTCGEHYKEVNAGNDMKMGCGYPQRLMKAMKLGALKRPALETAAEHILGLILKID